MYVIIMHYNWGTCDSELLQHIAAVLKNICQCREHILESTYGLTPKDIMLLIKLLNKLKIRD